MLTLTFALSSAIMYINFETKPINEKKLDCVYGELTAQFVLLAGFTSKNRKKKHPLISWANQIRSLFLITRVIGAKTLLMRSFRV